MDTNYANAGGGIVSGSSVGGGGGGGGGVSAAAIAVGVNSSSRYNASYYKDPLISCQGSITYNSFDPYGGGTAGVRASSVYPYDAEAEFKERTGMGKVKTSHQQLAGNTVNNSVKIQQQHSYNANSCYGSYNQNSAALTPETGNYYAYAYDQHHHYPQQQQQYHQNQLQQQQQQQYKHNVNAKVVSQQQLHIHQQHQHQHQQQQHHHPHQHQQQQHNLNSGTVNGMKITPPDYGGYAPYHHHLQHPYYYPPYHHQASQKGGVGLVKTMPDASAMPYVNSKMLHSATVGGARVPQYPSSYSFHPHGYPSTVSAGHHTYQSQGVCDDSRWIWNSGSSNSEYQNSCRSAYPAYVNGSAAKQTTMWPSMPMQYQNQMSSGYPATAANQSCCSTAQNTANYYPQQYVKYPMQSLPNAMDYNGITNDLYSNSQVNSALSPATASPKIYTDLNAQPQSNSCQMMNSSPVSCRRDYNTSATLDYNGRYLQQQQTDSPSSSSASSTSSYNNLYYHNLHPYAHQAFATAEPQENLYSQQQVDTKIGLTTKSQNLRDFLSTWNEDEDECSDRTDVSFIEKMHLPSDHFGQSQDQLNGISNQKVENHLQFKGSFTSRPKIHVGITVDSTVESDQYINLPDIIIDIEKSSKDVLNLPEDILVANIPKIEKEDTTIIKEEMPNTEGTPPSTTPTPISTSTIETNNSLPQYEKEQKKERQKLPCYKRISRLQKLRFIHQRRSKNVPRKLLHPKIRRIKNKSFTQARLNPQSLKCLCVSLINSDKFRNRILGPSEIDSFIQLTTDNEVNNIDTVSALSTVSAVSAVAVTTNPSSSSVIPKLSDLCKNALNSSFDRDVLVINLDEILDSDNLFVVQCDINENILENYVDQQLQIQEQQEPTHQQQIQLQLQQQQRQQNEQQQHDNAADLVEILNDNNNNYNSEISGGNYLATSLETTTMSTTATAAVVIASVSSQATQTKPINTNISSSNSTRRMSIMNSSSSSKDIVTAIPTNRIREKLKRCCSVAEVSNLPLDNAVEHNDLNSVTTNPLVHLDSLSLSLSPPSPCSSSCPAALHYDTSSVLIEQNCPIQQITNEHEQLHEMLMLSEVVHVVSDDDIDDDVVDDVVDVNREDDQRPSSQHDHHDPHHLQHDHQHLLENDTTNISESNNGELLLMASSVATPMIHHEEIVPDNMKKFQNEKFLKYLHAKYVQGNLSKFYHANRIIKKYKKRIIKKILNIVR